MMATFDRSPIDADEAPPCGVEVPPRPRVRLGGLPNEVPRTADGCCIEDEEPETGGGQLCVTSGELTLTEDTETRSITGMMGGAGGAIIMLGGWTV